MKFLFVTLRSCFLKDIFFCLTSMERKVGDKVVELKHENVLKGRPDAKCTL
jgi:hypothetical protein